MTDILPDSRARYAKGVTSSPNGNLINVYCANCGKPYGKVPEKLLTHCFILCQPCADVYGNDAHFYEEPDAVFWRRVEEAQREECVSTPQELAIQLDDPTSKLAKLADEWRKHVEKVG